MNTPGTMALGWGLLLVAGGGGLYFAKKDINERRRDQARRGIRSTDTREWHERVADHQKPQSNQPLDNNATASSGVEPASQPGLASTFSKFDRQYRQPDPNSKPPHET
ncbi:uncharacterized protein PGTG_04227 [Puccinia graminis f. sp. tritici CRL 75-36-700-3]|uniref:Uncharacterized protein n=2 Tax=Puccinia graminis f. sp. tritici TaxID=56615 RepID=E3K1U6_PUCGT|nr:uncharacterized protein PGTG_04227 [Puccinia graminis f. sp. tritici CRL 75-36-700-3]EFP78271.1 hypothetical protein PGTG_04227 [Puccinia graminis f. sp. tritici CRL 75-36-700-3]